MFLVGDKLVFEMWTVQKSNIIVRSRLRAFGWQREKQIARMEKGFFGKHMHLDRLLRARRDVTSPVALSKAWQIYQHQHQQLRSR